MEGVDDEVILTFLFLVVSCFVIAVLYLRSRRTHSRLIPESNGEIETDTLTSERGTETTSNAEQWSDDGRRSDNVHRDNTGPRSSDNTTESSAKVSASKDFNCDGVRRRLKEQTRGSVETNATTSKAYGTNGSSFRNEVDENFSHNNHSSLGTSTGTSPASSYSTNMGFNTSHGTNTEPSTQSSHGTNIAPNTPGSYGTNMVPSAGSRHGNNMDQNTTSLNDASTRPSYTSSHGNNTQPSTTSSNNSTNTESGRMAAIRVKYQETERAFTVDMFMKVGDLKRYRII